VMGYKKYIIALLFISVLGWGLTRARCMKRGAEFNARVEEIKNKAHDKLKIGTHKDDVARFFAENSIPVFITKLEARGTVFTTGCSPVGCGTNKALIGVAVELDESGTVKAELVVIGMYTDCL